MVLGLPSPIVRNTRPPWLAFKRVDSLRPSREVQKKFKEKYSSAQNKKKIAGLVSKFSSNKSAYLKALEPLRVELEAGSP